MFASSGRFSTLHCILYQYNACKRPYCLFKHELATSLELQSTSLDYISMSLSQAYTPHCDFIPVTEFPAYKPSYASIKTIASPVEEFIPPSSSRKKRQSSPAESVTDKRAKLDQLLTELESSSDSDSSPDSQSKLNNPAETNETSSGRPTMPLKWSAKIPFQIRIRYLNQLIDLHLQTKESQTMAYKNALESEQKCHDDSLNRSIYLASMAKLIKTLQNPVPSLSSTISQKPVSLRPASILKSPTDIPAVPKSKTRLLTPTEKLEYIVTTGRLHGLIQSLKIPLDKLESFGFPRLDPIEKGRAKLKISESEQLYYSRLKPNQRHCTRCKKAFAVDKFGDPMHPEACLFHWGKPNQRCNLQSTFLYTCCGNLPGSEGCSLSKGGHVYDSNRYLDTDGFIQTLPALQTSSHLAVKPNLDSFLSQVQVPLAATTVEILEICRKADPVEEERTGALNSVLSLDCEMVYTSMGYELARVSVVNARMDLVYEKLVKPSGTIIDCNTRFSGITEQDLDSAESYLTDVQFELLNLFDDQTVLMGHGLENDLISLKLIHDNIVDTSHVFPHRRGLPLKRALRNLASEMLFMPIQNNLNGHDSKEDAIAVMKLIQLKAKSLFLKK